MARKAGILYAVTDEGLELRQSAGGMPILSAQLRLQDMARLLADALAPTLLLEPSRDLYLLDIGTGPPAVCLNALILLRRGHPGALEDRRVVIASLDGEGDGDGDGAGVDALSKMQSWKGPLAGLNIRIDHRLYDWTGMVGLEPALLEIDRHDALAAAAAGNGLFEHGTDEEILGSLAALREVMLIVASVTRGLDEFRALVTLAGYDLGRVIERPFGTQVLLACRQVLI